jgi:HSP20 family protein
MADVMIYLGQTENGLRGRTPGHAMEYERGMRRRGAAPVFLLRLRGFLTTSPFDLMRRFSENMDWFFESWSISVMTVWSPSIAISETDEHVKVRAELPGLNENDVRVELTQDELTISGERKREEEDRREGSYWSERFCRSFRRAIPIPDEAQVENATATFENEILTVSVPVPSNGQSPRLSARVWLDLEVAETLN